MPESGSWDATVHSAISDSVVRTLETMFFDFAEPVDIAAPNGDELVCMVEFRGGCSGRLYLRMSESRARTLGASFLGADTELLTRDEVRSTICELANMICGSVLSRLEPLLIFALSEPVILEDAVPGSSRTWSWFETGSGAIAVYLDGVQQLPGVLCA